MSVAKSTLSLLFTFLFLGGCTTNWGGGGIGEFTDSDSLGSKEPGIHEQLYSQRLILTIDDVVEILGPNYGVARRGNLIGLVYETNKNEFGDCFNVGLLYKYSRCYSIPTRLMLIFNNSQPHIPDSRVLIYADSDSIPELTYQHTLSIDPVVGPATTGLIAGYVAALILEPVFDNAIDDAERRANRWAREDAPGQFFEGSKKELERREPELQRELDNFRERNSEN